MENNKVLRPTNPELAERFELVTNPTLNPDFVPEAERLIEACGFLPTMMIESQNPDSSLKAALEENYPFGANWNSDGVIDEQGVYRYPEDEPLSPIMSITNKLTDDVAYIYQYGIVAARNEKGEYVTGRFD